jgi:hypothetical protein
MPDLAAYYWREDRSALPPDIVKTSRFCTTSQEQPAHSQNRSAS